MALEKLSAAQVNNFMVKAASLLRKQQARIAELEGEKAAWERREHAEKIAHQAISRGIMSEDEADKYAEKLAGSSDDLNMVEEFVNRAAAGVPLGKTLEKTASDDHDNRDGQVDVLTAFLLSSEH